MGSFLSVVNKVIFASVLRDDSRFFVDHLDMLRNIIPGQGMSTLPSK